MTARAWCVTAFQDLDKLHSDLQNPNGGITDVVRYAVWQFEKAPGTDRTHIQAYVEFKSPVRIAGVKKILGSSVHVERRMGTASQARDYCMKAESRVEGKGPYEIGVFGGEQGKRNDLAEAAEVLKKGGIYAVAEKHPMQFIKYHKGFHVLDYTLRTTAASSALRDVDVTVIYGAPGTGKTQLCWDISQSLEGGAYRLNPPAGRSSHPWFDGYNHQKMLIVDEMDGSWMDWNFLMNLLDKYPMQLPVKGGHLWANYTTIFITSNKAPGDWYPFFSGGMDKDALMRRIKAVYKAEKIEDDLCNPVYILTDEEGNMIDKRELYFQENF